MLRRAAIRQWETRGVTSSPILRHPLTVANYLALGEDDDQHRYELQEGNLLSMPSGRPHHNIARSELFGQVDPQLPEQLRVVPDVDIDLQLVPANQPGTVRRPDLVVVQQAAMERVDREGGVLRASEVVLAVEIVSPGSRRTDQLIKRGEYADAGIPHYWIIELDERPSLVVCHLAGGFGYQDAPAATGSVQALEPFSIHLDLDQLR
jgi:Uma2 family endonuclease